MLTTNLKQLLAIMLKNSFDIDMAVFTNFFAALITIVAVLKLYILKALHIAEAGWNGIKEDAQEIRVTLIEARERWENSDFRENLLHPYRSLRNSIHERRYHSY